MTLLVAIRSFGANWSAEAWQKRFAERLGDRPVRLATERDIDPGAVRYIAAWKPVPGSLARFPNLAAIFNLGAGVDALLADQALPDVPIVRGVDQNLTRRMTEYIVLHVLYHHRQMPRLLGAQSRSHWDAPDQPFAAALASNGRIAKPRFGVMERGDRRAERRVEAIMMVGAQHVPTGGEADFNLHRDSPWKSPKPCGVR